MKFFAFSLLCVWTWGCGAQHHVPDLTLYTHTVEIHPGDTLVLDFGREVDNFPLGTQWTGKDLEGSPLELMAKIPVVVKSDDYGQPVDASTARFMELVSAYEGIVSTGIITAALGYDLDVLDTYKAWHAQGWELWFHGHTHQLGSASSEFWNRPLLVQEASFKRGLARAEERLGVVLKAFGAPGNKTDANTAYAVASSGMDVWLFGDEENMRAVDSRVDVFPRQINIEPRVGDMQPPEVFEQLLQQVEYRENPLVLQVHPWGYVEKDLHFAETIFKAMASSGRYQYTTPSAWFAWKRDRASVVLKKTGAGTYLLDATKTMRSHVLRYGVELPKARIALDL
jgi:hypothetical protein